MADVCDLDVCDLEDKEVAEIIVNTIIHLKSVKRTKATAEKIFNCMKKADENPGPATPGGPGGPCPPPPPPTFCKEKLLKTNFYKLNI